MPRLLAVRTLIFKYSGNKKMALASAPLKLCVVNQSDITYDDKDHFIERNGVSYAGTHLIIDLWGAKNLDNINLIEAAFREAVVNAGATLLHTHFHHFTPNGGVSGVAVLAESHISIHSWPEKGYAALDVFMCGDAQPHQTIQIFKKAFSPDRILLNEQMRGGTFA